MPNKNNATMTNFVGGELSPYMEGRFDLELFQKSLQWCQNFLIQPQGGASFRPGTFQAGLSKNNSVAFMLPFQFSANDAYVIVLTHKKFRFYRNNGVILNTAKNITGVTNANPAVVTSASHGYANGDEVYITGLEGMTALNGRFYKVAGVAANTFQLQDQFGNNVDSTSTILNGTYSSGGTVASIYELTTAFHEADLFDLRQAQVADIMYIDSQNYAPRKVIRTAHTAWTFNTYSRTNDPFDNPNPSITAMTIANPAVFTSGTHGLAVGDRVFIEGTGTAQVSGQFFIVRTVPAGTTFTLFYDDGVTVVDSTGWSHSNGNTVTKLTKFPKCVGFTADGRIGHANTRNNPEGLWLSRAPSGTTTRFEDFTTSSTATDAVLANLAPVEGVIDSIQEMKQLRRQLVMLGASSVRRLYGSTPDTPVTPTAINAQPTIEGSARVRPLVVGGTMLFVDVSGKKLLGFQYNLSKDDFETQNFNLVADHMGEVQFIKIIRVKGDPDCIWVLRSDGLLLSFTFNGNENIAGWARHPMGGGGRVEDICTIRRDTGEDQLWLVVKRTMGGKTYRSIEVMSARPAFPLRRNFFTGTANQAADKARYENATWEQLKNPSFLDMAITFDGTTRGIEKNATLTPSAATGNNITITADNAVFRADHIGRQIWKRYAADGTGGGMATITGYVDTTHVFAQVEADFDNVNAIAPGSWEFAVNAVQNAHLYEGLTVDVQADGSAHPAVTIANGIATLQQHASRIHLGFKHIGLMATQNVDIGGRSGPNNSKPRNIKKVRARFKDSIGCKIGPSEYSTQTLIFRKAEQIMGRVPPPYTGMKDLTQIVPWNKDSVQVVIVHDEPTPLTVTALDIEVDSVDQT